MFARILIANRGEIAIRIARACAALDVTSIAVFSEDDADALHVRRADQAFALQGRGAAAYLDVERIVEAARASHCDALHPGYGFLSENGLLARRCADAGIAFIGPQERHLTLFGDKVAARRLAQDCAVPVAAGGVALTCAADAVAFLATLGPPGAGRAMMIKAVAGGGGRGIRVVRRAADAEAAFDRCASEAQAAFGNGALYAEEFIEGARHVEVQVLADRHGGLIALGERDCTLQRRHQKLVEIAPSPGLPDGMRIALTRAALALARAVQYESLGTFEFLLRSGNEGFVFMEANPRLQVEHTVTEAVLGIDLVQMQIRAAAGARLAELGLDPETPPLPRGHAIELRVNMERLDARGQQQPATGTLAVFDLPSGPGVRVDTLGYTGYQAGAAFDSLLAKLIVHSPSPGWADALGLAARALGEFRIEGVPTNLGLLRALLAHPDVLTQRIDTGFVEAHGATLATQAELLVPQAVSAGAASGRLAPADVDFAGSVRVVSPTPGRVIALNVALGDAVSAGDELAVIESMKMEMVVAAEQGGVIHALAVHVGDQVLAGSPLLYLVLDDAASITSVARDDASHDFVQPRAELQAVLDRRARGLDAQRAQAIARRHARGMRSARQNIADLCDADSFTEYGAFAIAAQRSRRPLPELIADTPADGLIAGTARINGALFDEAAARAMVLAYDATVFAGTQGHIGHLKIERMVALAESARLPLVLFAEGGGGRPGDDDFLRAGGLQLMCFARFAHLSGWVPLVGVVAGRCFAGNAALLGCCDVIIATRDANIGMAGPAMIEGGGLGHFKPEQVGPVAVQSPNGVIDIVVDDEATAVDVARRYLAYFQGPLTTWGCADQLALRHAVPANRVRGYDIGVLLETLADTDSLLPLRGAFGAGLVTALMRVEGRPMGVIASNPLHLGGAIDADAADKGARFMQLCNAHGLPLLFLCDTPGFMVGPDAEKTALVRHVSRLFVNAARLEVPFFAIVLRKAYGLGAQAMAGGSLHAPRFAVAWPTAEFGPMGIEGAVRLAYKRELEALADPAMRAEEFSRRVAQELERGSALNAASFFEVDDVIDPAQSRQWIVEGLRAAAPAPVPRPRRSLDTW